MQSIVPTTLNSQILLENSFELWTRIGIIILIGTCCLIQFDNSCRGVTIPGRNTIFRDYLDFKIITPVYVCIGKFCKLVWVRQILVIFLSFAFFSPVVNGLIVAVHVTNIAFKVDIFIWSDFYTVKICDAEIQKITKIL